MAHHPIRPPVRLGVETLETRELPAVGAWRVESFDGNTGPLNASQANWGNLGPVSFTTSPITGAPSGTNTLVSSGMSNTAARFWSTVDLPANGGVSAQVQANSLQPEQLIVRGSGLSTNTPTYYAVSIERGVSLELVRVINGVSTSLGRVKSSLYFSVPWMKLSLTAVGNTLAVQAQRVDNGQYLNSAGQWQTAETNALAVTDSAITSGGKVGVQRPAKYSGDIRLDDLTILTPSGFSSNDRGFAQYNSTTGTGSYSSTNGSTITSRAWRAQPVAADATVSATMRIDSNLAGQLLVRGTNLDTSAPKYYAISVRQGGEVTLVKVVNGQETEMAKVMPTTTAGSAPLWGSLAVRGNQLSVALRRADNGQYLTSNGSWQAEPTYVIVRTDTSITEAGVAGLGRVGAATGGVQYADFQFSTDAPPGTAPVVSVSGLPATATGLVPLQLQVTSSLNVTRVEYLVDGQLLHTRTAAPWSYTLDTRTLTNGGHILQVRAIDSAGRVGQVELAFAVDNPASPSTGPISIPRHYSHIRIAQLAYSGLKIGATEERLLRESVDLVIPFVGHMDRINQISPDTPQMLYSNASNIYGEMLPDWFAFADKNGISREDAFYHVTGRTAFSGASSGSQPVNWLWDVQRGPSTGTGTWTSMTWGARGTTDAPHAWQTFGNVGQSVYMGYIEKFRELNVVLQTPAAGAWQGVFEYASAVDANGNPTAWKTLNLKSDGTAGLRKSGQIVFDPPADWKPGNVNGSQWLYFIRVRTIANGTAPVTKTLLGRDYVGANKTSQGFVPAFDSAADKDNDGYLNDAEYATRKAGFDARFVYETRAFYPYYGQLRHALNPSNVKVREWLADYHGRLLDRTPLADGVFLDNSGGKYPVEHAVQESSANYSENYADLVSRIRNRVGPRLVLPNTSGGGAGTAGVIRATDISIEEFALRPLSSNHSQFEDISNLVKSRLALKNPSPYMILDSLPTGGSPTDARTQLATLAMYYLVADPEKTFLMFYGGFEPSSAWERHWSEAAKVNVGLPTADWSVFATGTDPSNSRLAYKVYGRQYSNAQILYKPLSYTRGVGNGTLADNTITYHNLGGNYRQVRADGTLGPVIDRIGLRNGEGAVLIKA